MTVQELLDFAWRDVLSAANDQVLQAADDIAVAVRIERTEVPGVHPSVGIDRIGGPGRVSPVAVHNTVAARQ